MSTCTQAEFARRLNVTRATVNVWKRLAKIVMSGNEVDIELSEARLALNRDTTRPRNAQRRDPLTPEAEQFFAGFTPLQVVDAPGDGETIADAAGRMTEAHAGESFDVSKARKERYAGLLNQLKYDQESGLVVAVADVAAIVGAQLATVRTKLIAIPSEHAPRIARLKTANEVQDALLEVIVEALSELTADAAP